MIESIKTAILYDFNEESHEVIHLKDAIKLESEINRLEEENTMLKNQLLEIAHTCTYGQEVDTMRNKIYNLACFL